MTKVTIAATGDGACLFNALAIGLGTEILSGRLDNQQNSPGYQNLIAQFSKQHPHFSPKSWENLKIWVAFYNDSRDMELIFAPVLFRLNQRYKNNNSNQVLNELVNLVWKNKDRIQTDSPWYTFNDIELFSKLDNLNLQDKKELLVALKEILKKGTVGEEREAIKKHLETAAADLLSKLNDKVNSDPNDYQRGYNCGELKKMADDLSITLVENQEELSSAKKTPIFLINQKKHWDVNLADRNFINTALPKLKISSHQVYKEGIVVAAPSADDIKSLEKSHIVFREDRIDNPGKGNCAFYAFAIGLIHIIQEEESYGNKAMFDRWKGLDESIGVVYEDICNFDFKKHNLELLDQLQRSLRITCFSYQIKELRGACSNPRDDYKLLMANSNYVNFAALYYGNPLNMDPRYNPFAGSDAIKAAISKIDGKTVKPNFENKQLIPLFIRLLYGDVAVESITSETNPLMSSPVISAMQEILKDFFWGTHLDLDYLSVAFKVNLHPLVNGVPRQKFVDNAEQHAITVNNENNAHWTTKVVMAREFSGLKSLHLHAHSENNKLEHSQHHTTTPSVVTEQGVHGNNPITQDVSTVKKLQLLKDEIVNITASYNTYNKSVWYSIFHRHSRDGRIRATQFQKDFLLINDYSQAQNALIEYLSNKNNGNTHPHSYRTMLLDLMTQTANVRTTSRNFREKLEQLKSDWGVTGGLKII